MTTPTGAATGTVVIGLADDLSSDQALAWAVDQAVAEHRPLTLAHAMGRLTTAWNAGVVDPQVILQAMRDEGRAVLARARRLVEERAPGLEVHEVLEATDARDLLQHLSHSASLLVLGSRGRGPVRSLLLGSVGAAIAHHVACPTVIHRPGHVGTVRQGVLAACDPSPESRAVLEFAYREAELRRLPLTVLHCYWDPQSYALGEYPVDHTTADLETERLDLSEAMAGLGEKYPGVHTTTELVHGMPEVAVVRESRRMDLVVVGAHQGWRVKRLLFGSVSTAVLEHAEVPVALVPVGRDTA